MNTAGPKFYAKSTIDRPSEASSTGSIVCTAVTGALNATPLVNPETPDYMISRAKLVLTPKVVIRPAKIGIATEEKSTNGV
jgi:hypothetical protein